MSFDALAWASKQSTGSSGTKLVLLGLAECADRQHGLAFPSVSALVEFSSLDRKSVIANLTKLEESGFIADTERKVGATKQIKVYRLNLEIVPISGQSQKRNGSDISGNSPKNGTRNKSEPVKSEAKASSAGKHLIPSDWKPPALADLPPRAQANATQWTDASYQTEAEAFGCYWRSERKMKADWNDTWANRIVARHSAIMRDQKYGNAPTDIKRESTPAEQIASLERMIPLWEQMGRDGDVEAARRTIAELEHPPDPAMAAKVTSIIPNLGQRRRA